MPALVSATDEEALGRARELGTQGALALPELLSLFAHHSWAVRRGVVAALQHADDATLAALSRSLVERRTHEPTIAGIVDALAGASGAVEPHLSALLTRPEPAVLCDAIQVAGRRGGQALVPRLIELSAQEDDNVALAAVEALGRIGGERAIDRLVELARSDNFFRAFPAIEGLGRTRETRALPALRKLLTQPIYAAEAARAMGRIGSVSAVAPLLQALHAAPESLLRVIAQSLSAIHDATALGPDDPSTISRLVRELAHPTLREQVTRALASADSSEAIALGRVLVWLADTESTSDFVRLLRGSDDVAMLAIEGLKRLSALADPRVIEELRSGSSELRARLLPAFRGVAIGSEAVIRCLSDPQPSVRALACHVLASGNTVSSVPQLFRMLEDSDVGVVQAAIAAIQSLGSNETEEMARRAARSTHRGERRAGLRIVMYFGYRGALELCREALLSDDERLRDIALAGLPALEQAEGLPLLLEATQHASARTRASALRALGHVAHGAEVEAALRAGLNDADPWVRYYACQSLGRLRVTSALPLLVGKLDDTAAQVQLAAIEALASIPGDAATQALAAAARSEDVDLRRTALVGIGERGDEALRPAVLESLKSSDSTIRMVAVSSLAKFERSEEELGNAALHDPDPGVRAAAIELLSNRASPAATLSLLRALAQTPSSRELVAALGRDVETRLPLVLAQLDGADELFARALVAALARADARAYRAALEQAFASRGAPARRAAAWALSSLADDTARGILARAASSDPDPEVRRICAAALA